MTKFKKGDKVTWNTPQGSTTGKVTKKITSNTSTKSHDVTASSDNPQYEVRSNKSGGVAAHKPDSLKKA